MNNINHFFRNAKIKSAPSYLAIAIIVIYIIATNYNSKNWEKENHVIVNDIKLYYAYLPAIFIYNDLSFDFVYEDFEKHKKHLWFIESPKGDRTLITTFGMAMAYSPFFLITRAIAPLLGYESEYSLPYKFALIFSSLFYVLLGLFFIRKLLLKYFTEIVTSITILIIGLGTNLFIYTTREAPMPHAYEFGLISTYLFLVYKWYEKPKIIYTFWVGFLAGLITLIRPTNILVLLILFFWGITSFEGMVQRVRFFIRSYKLVIIMIGSFILIWIPQFLYWYDISGSIFFYSYEKSGGNFYFANSQIFNQWFSYRKGWLVYTPIMIFAITGFVFLARNRKELFMPVLIYFLAMVFILSSWWSWWFGGGFGIRSYIDMYGVLAIPIAATLTAGLKSKVPVKIVILSLVGFLIFLNLFQTFQYRKGIIHYDSMTKKAYWSVFLKKRRPANFYQLLEKPDYQKARKGVYEIVPNYYSKD
ncbi:MAG: hypothetical protein ISS18_15770 [Bacteroidales bacterium]|nr:hypothetical protein [Bacteroidales bacterium]